jgi:hypothetical protein
VTELLTRPEGAGSAFLRGAGLTVGAFIVPMAGVVFFGLRHGDSPWRDIEIATAIIAVGAGVVGGLSAVWASFRCWAFDRFVNGPD